MSYIYKITNTINGKMYVGNTSKSINDRWKTHRHDAHRERCAKRPLYAAMNEYGFDKFEISVIEECDNEIAPSREQYWIKKLNTFNDGYNDTMGGKGKPQIVYDDVLRMYASIKNQRDTGKALGISTDSVKKILEKESFTKFSKLETLQNRIKKVKVYTGDKVFIKRFNSTKIAATWLCEQRTSTPHSSAETNIYKACRSGNKAYGYYWKFD